MKNVKFLGLALALSLPVFSANAASTTADAKQTVQAAIGITKVSDLLFGTAVQSDPLKTILTTDAGAAAFTVTGEANKAFTLSFGAPSINMVHDTLGAGANQEIAVNAFTSDAPAALDADGSITVKVGATRAALGAAQAPGSYTGNFTVNVVY